MTISETIDTPAWKLAGDAWSHAATDWAYGFEPYARDAIEDLFGRLEVGDGTRLLDVACGAGYAVSRAERLGATVSGLDASEGLVEIARRRAPNAELRVGDMFALSWADGVFDVVTSFNGIWGGCEGAVAEMGRVVRPGGGVGLTFWGPGRRLDLRDWFIAVGRSTPAVGEEMMALADIATPGVVEEMLFAAGFDDVERASVPSILEFRDDETAWRVFRSPGVVLPALEAVGEAALRELMMGALDAFRADDGSYRFVNELVAVTARRR